MKNEKSKNLKKSENWKSDKFEKKIKLAKLQTKLAKLHTKLAKLQTKLAKLQTK